MPEMHFTVRWPDGSVERGYSPSWVIEEHLEVGATYSVSEFVERTGRALGIASERVRAKYGFACSSALDQQRSIEEKAAALPPAAFGERVEILSFEKHAPRDARAQSPDE